MDVVYKLIFKSRLERNEPPFYYIGSKSNITLINGKMVDKRGVCYFGSSRWPGYSKLVDSEEIEVEILYEGPNIIEMEKDIHLKEDVVANTNYFNLSIATISNFSNPSYATYINTATGKIVRLERDHPMVLNGSYVGVSKGITLSEETKLKISKNNTRPFLGRTHSKESLEKMSKSKLGIKASQETKEKMSAVRKGVKKTDEHKDNISKSSKGLISLAHPDGRRVRVKRKYKELYESEGFMNISKLLSITGSIKKVKCPHCTTVGTPGNMNRWHFDNCKFLKGV